MTVREEDEFLHAPPAPTPSRWQENMFFICWDVASDSGLLCHIRRAPTMGVQEAQVVVALDGRVGSSLVEGAFTAEALVAPLSAVPVDPFRRWSFRFDGRGVEGAGPLGFVAVAAGGDTPITVDITLESALPVVDFAERLTAMVAAMRAAPDGPQMGEQQHYEQGGTWYGRLRVGDGQRDVSGLFVRDHSWGVRREQQQFEAFWTASCLDEGRIFCNAIGVPSGDRVVGIGAVVDASGVTFTQEVSASFSPAAGIAAYERTTVAFGAPVARTLTAQTCRHLPLYLPGSGTNRYDNNAISTAQMHGAAGFGVMEWASVLSDADAALLHAEPIT
ncbi:MAG: hypothetical protein H0W70_09145 [Actinobacteria bacterium]|nr:hypothetical protein [Actinomycetota bacterium]